MGRCKISDTWQDFSAYWRLARLKNVDEQIRLWQTSYMKKYPELLSKQVQNYEEENVNWREIAKKIFPLLPRRFQLMRKARNALLLVCEPIYKKALEKLELDFNIVFVIHVGIGWGQDGHQHITGNPQSFSV